MLIEKFKNINYISIEPINDTNRDIGFSKLENCIIIGRNNFYPNVLIYSYDILVNPYDEKIMSLNKDSFYENNTFDFKLANEQISQPIVRSNNFSNDLSVFFFIYNFDNYYHFLYDTLPYLYTYLKLKKDIPNLKLLINYPNKNMNHFYKFNNEFLEKIIDMNDIIIHNENNVYKYIYISSSLTHGGYSNNKPRNEIYDIYNIIAGGLTTYRRSNSVSLCNTSSPKKIYISRRTWINNDTSNIGTNYTTRRKMLNEDVLVKKLEEIGFVEIFAENLSTDEKINIFKNAEVICGCIGGGMANLLFSKPTTKTIIIVTPFFLEINNRFRFSLENTNYKYFNNVDIYHDEDKLPMYCRVKIIDDKSKYYNFIGEICDWCNNHDTSTSYLINLANNDITGFNNDTNFDNEFFDVNQFELLDNGLNSPYIVNINLLVDYIENV
jgi:hypothetical protein